MKQSDRLKEPKWGALHVRCYIEERTIDLANYIIEHKCTVREAAKKFGISKSTVHTVVTRQKLFI